ncbi:MAG TPA: NAD-dependent epimerase/dehydratase family protein [Longimicrobium sp.]|jgi:nucleoside-diphosphate-sugar epimerase
MAERLPLPGTVLVTGATGFLGAYVVDGLLKLGVGVRALVRSEHASLPASVQQVRAADLTDRAALRAACAGVDAVVHLAARTHILRDSARDPLERFRAVNVEGTRVLLREALDAGATRFVYASSVKAVGEGSAECWTGDVTARPADAYGISKMEAEEVVRDEAAGIHAPILRLPLLYGAGVRANMLRLFRTIDRGVPMPVGGIHNRRSLGYAGNVVAAIETVLTAPAARRATLFVSDDDDVSTPELVRRIAAALGVSARIVPCPRAIARLAARAGDVVSRAVPVPFTTGALERLTGSLCVDVGALRGLGWAPRYTMAEGMADTARWYRGLHPRT